VAQKLFSLPSSYEEVELVNRLIRGYLVEENVEEHLRNAVEMCLMEALNNCIKHAYRGEQNHSIDVNVCIDSELMEIQIIDEGIPRESLVIKELDFDPNDIENLPEGGMGLFIIKQLMDELDYYTLNGKNYFTLRKYLYS
jgi:serine/threonine-protein kinase RsbW